MGRSKKKKQLSTAGADRSAKIKHTKKLVHVE
jgi:hypothetical protein